MTDAVRKLLEQPQHGHGSSGTGAAAGCTLYSTRLREQLKVEEPQQLTLLQPPWKTAADARPERTGKREGRQSETAGS